MEIAGVFGLDKFMKQRDSTIHWKNLDKKKNELTEKKKKTTKLDKKRNENLFETNDDDETIGGDREGEHLKEHNNKNKVYKGDGEMPEGALSSSEEDERVIFEIYFL